MKAVKLIAACSMLAAVGCISVKTESEIKPIHIVMDINLKVDKDLDKAFADEDKPSGGGAFAVSRDLVSRHVAGFTNKAMLAERDGATDEDRIVIAEENAKRLRRFTEIAKSSGVAVENVQKRRVTKLREKLPAGAWYQDDDGEWRTK